MAETKATRAAYGEALAEFGAKYPNLVVLDADLTKSTMTATFKKEFPERHINAGIAESNMIGVAAGIASTGKVAFASTFAVFASGRTFDQIRVSVCYANQNVKIGATHAGITVGEDGATHQANEDIAIMRALPNMTVICPADAVETRAAVEASILHDGPVYLRMGRSAVPVIHTGADYKFEIGKSITMKEGSDVTIIATGMMVALALEAAQMLSNEGISARVIDMHTIKPMDKEAVIKAAKETGCIVTAEEHVVAGGLGSAVSEVICESVPVPVVKLGIEDTFGKSGTADELLTYYGLTSENIVQKAKAALALKK